MRRWKVSVAFVTPIGKTVYSNNPLVHINAVYCLLTGFSLYADVRSNTVKYFAFHNRLKISSMNGNGYAIFSVTLFNLM